MWDPHTGTCCEPRATAKRSGAAASVQYEDEQLTIKVKTRTQEASREWMRRITGWLVVGHGPTNRASATVEEDETGTETDEERAANKLDDLATAFERNRTAKRRHSEIHQGKTLWTEALRTGEVQIGNDRLPNGVTKAIKSPIDSSTCRQLKAALRERMLVIVRTARRDDAKNAAQLLASMTRGDRVRENALFDAISAREPTHGAQSDFDQGAIALNALHASITEHGVDENARERVSTAIRQVGMGPVSSKSARDSLMWCLRRLIEQDSANTGQGRDWSSKDSKRASRNS